MPQITPNLWFDGNSLEAATFYVSIFPRAEITGISYYGEPGPQPPGTVLTVDFVLDGQAFAAINGGPEFPFDEAVSFLISCADQAEIDHYWAALGEGGEPGPCGWLKDRFGLSWQVVPAILAQLLGDPDRARRDRAMAAVRSMGKLDVAAIQAAADET